MGQIMILEFLQAIAVLTSSTRSLLFSIDRKSQFSHPVSTNYGSEVFEWQEELLMKRKVKRKKKMPVGDYRTLTYLRESFDK